MADGFTHFDENGSAVMVDVGGKDETARTAVACGTIQVSREIIDAIESGSAAKGDVLGVARIAGIMAVKKTSEIIPLAHPLYITKAAVEFEVSREENCVRAICTVKTTGKTGVEMEALTGVSASLLTIYDMCKAIDKRMVMTDIHLVEKTGGKSGDFRFGNI